MWRQILTAIVCLSRFKNANLQSLSSNCGKVDVTTRITFLDPDSSENDAHPGDWPWLAPLFRKPGKYFCGATLISERHLLTAAHCFEDFGTKYRAADYYALLGRHNIEDSRERHWLNRSISEIYLHSDFALKSEAYKSNADIAVLSMKEEAIFSERIRPICLPRPTANTTNVYGTVVGYGKSTSSRAHEATPKQGRLHTISHVQCIYKNPSYALIVSERSFCAGDTDSTPCRGDSGSGFYARSGGQAFEIYGIVSQAFYRYECNPEDYVVFVDVTRFVGWIRENLEGKVTEYDCCRWPGDDYPIHLSTETFEIAGGEKVLTEFAEISPKYKSSSVRQFNLANWCDNFKIGCYDRENVKFLPVKVSELFPNIIAYYAKYYAIQRVSRKNFAGMRSLLMLGLYDNAIETIEGDSFDDLAELKYLDMSKNRIRELGPRIFEKTPKLERINLYANQISVIAPQLFARATQITIISLCRNKLTSLSPNAFVSLRRLKKLILCDNSFTSLPPNVVSSSNAALVHINLRTSGCIDSEYGSNASTSALTESERNKFRNDLLLLC